MSTVPAFASQKDAVVDCLMSIVIPVWNDDETLGATLGLLSAMSGCGEIVVAAFSPGEKVVDAVRLGGATLVECAQAGRGSQMNEGAALARGNVLLFHHADTLLTAEHVAALLEAMRCEPDVCGGAFHRKFDERHPWLRWLEPLERRRVQWFGGFFGDQSIFVRRDVFIEMGGFSAMPLLEDVEMAARLRRIGRVRLLDPPIASSPRKHLAAGPWRTTFQNAFILVLYFAGVSTARLHAWYYRKS